MFLEPTHYQILVRHQLGNLDIAMKNRTSTVNACVGAIESPEENALHLEQGQCYTQDLSQVTTSAIACLEGQSNRLSLCAKQLSNPNMHTNSSVVHGQTFEDEGNWSGPGFPSSWMIYCATSYDYNLNRMVR